MLTLILSILFSLTNLAGGQDNIPDSIYISSDSLKNNALEKQSSAFQQLRQQKMLDSVRQQQLQQELLDSRYDKVRQAELIREIERLKAADSLQSLSQRHRVDSLKKVLKGFPVRPFLDTLFFIYTRQGSFTPLERAQAVEKRIQTLNDDVGFAADSLMIIPSEQTVDLVYQGNLIIAVSEEDALWANTSTMALAQKYKAEVSRAIQTYRNETNIQVLLKEAGLALLVILLVVLIIKVLTFVMRYATAALTRYSGRWISGIKIRNYELLNSAQEKQLIVSMLNVLRWVLILLTIYLSLPVLFGIFPWTRGLSAKLLGFVLNPLRKIVAAVWNYLPNLFTIIVLVVVFLSILRFFRFLKVEVERGRLKIPGFYADWATPTFQIIRVLTLAFMLIVIFPYMPGSDSPIFKGVSVFMGVLFTFGSAGALSNLVAGLVLTYMRSFQIGDRVKIGDVNGDIIERSLLVTRVRTIKNEIISVPNSTVMNSHTVNYSADAVDKGLIINAKISIGYDIPWREVYPLLIAAASETSFIENEPAPFVQQVSLEDYYVVYQVNAYTKHPGKQAAIYSSLFENILDKFNEAKIEIMSPHFYAIRDGHEIAIPSSYLSDENRAAGIRVKIDKKDQQNTSD